MILNDLRFPINPIPKYPNQPVFQETEDAAKPADFAIDPAAPLKIEEESTTVSWCFKGDSLMSSGC